MLLIVIAPLLLPMIAKGCAYWLHCWSFLLPSVLVVGFQWTYAKYQQKVRN